MSLPQNATVTEMTSQIDYITPQFVYKTLPANNSIIINLTIVNKILSMCGIVG